MVIDVYTVFKSREDYQQLCENFLRDVTEV
jgi:hypothetical protein